MGSDEESGEALADGCVRLLVKLVPEILLFLGQGSRGDPELGMRGFRYELKSGFGGETCCSDESIGVYGFAVAEVDGPFR